MSRIAPIATTPAGLAWLGQDHATSNYTRKLCSFRRELLPELKMKKGGEREFAAAKFPFGSDTRGSGFDASLRASGGAHGYARQQQHGRCSIHPGFIRHMGALVHF